MARRSANKGNKLEAAVSAPVAYDDMKYRARDALSTLTRAEEIKRDKSLMPHVKKEARLQAKALAKVCSPKASGRR